MNNMVKKGMGAKITEPVETAVAAGREAVETAVKAGREAATKGYEQAMAIGKEQVEAVVKASTEAFKGYGDVTSFGRENAEAVVRSSTILATGVQDINKAWLGLAQSAVEESVTQAKNIFGCKSVQDVLQLQGEYVRGNFTKLVDESRRFADLTAKLSEEAVEPLARRVNATVEKLTKPLSV